MRRKNSWCLEVIFAIFLFLLFCSLASGIRINEAELNPLGNDSGNEWIELYSDSFVNLTSWWILSSNGRNMSFNASFSGYYVFNTSSNLLTNTNLMLFLANETKDIIYQTSVLDDSYNDIRSWQYCSWNWTFRNFTRGAENSCTQETQQNTTQNQTNQTNSTQNTTDDAYIKLEYGYEANNSEEFEVKVLAYNLGDYKYDVKVYVQFKENETIISDVYDENNSKWISGNFYVNEVFSGTGDKTKNFKLRIDSDYSDFSGEAWIKAKLRKKNSIVYETGERVITIKIKNVSSEEIATSSNDKTEENKSIIRLNKGKDIKSQTFWKSKQEYIKEYSIYFFIVFWIVVIIVFFVRWQLKK